MQATHMPDLWGWLEGSTIKIVQLITFLLNFISIMTLKQSIYYIIDRFEVCFDLNDTHG